MRAAAVAENENRDVENRVETDAAIWLVNRFWSDRFMHIAHVIATIVGVVCARAPLRVRSKRAHPWNYWIVWFSVEFRFASWENGEQNHNLHW